MSTPPVTTGLVLWLDADDPSTLTVDEGTVFAWADKAASRTFQWQLEGRIPTLDDSVLFPRPSVYFGNGGDRGFLTASSPVTSELPVTVFVMQYWPTPAEPYAALGIQNGFESNAIEEGAGTPAFFTFSSPQQVAGVQYYGSGSSYVYATGSRPQGVVYLHTYTITASMASSGIRVDQATASVASAGTSPSPISMNTIGSSDALYLANGALAEVLIYEGILSSGDIAAVETYLADKWSSAGGTNVSVDAAGVQAASGLGSVAVITTQAVNVALQGVTATAEVGNAGEDTERSVEVMLTSDTGFAAVGEATLKLDFSVFSTGVQGTIARGFVLVWSAVDDIQTPSWQNIEDGGATGPYRYRHVDYAGFAGGAYGASPISADTTTTYIVPDTTWAPVDDSQTGGGVWH